MIEEEIKQVNKSGFNCYKYAFFSKSGFDQIELDSVKTIDIKELFEI